MTIYRGKLRCGLELRSDAGVAGGQQARQERPPALQVLHHGFVEQPPVTDYRAIIDAIRRHGSVHYPTSVVPGEFRIWRRRLRQLARVAGLRISVTRTADYVLVEGPDFEVSDDDALATADVIGARLLGQVLSFDDALRARRRQRMRLAVPLDGDRDDGDR